MGPNRTLRVALLAVTLTAAASAAEALGWESVARGPHKVGFRLLELTDPSRSIGGSGGIAVQPRPVRVYLWYPADPAASAKPMAFARYTELADGDWWPAFLPAAARARFAFARGPLARSLGEAGYGALLAAPVTAIENAKAAAGPFPLVVFGQGLYYESPVAHAMLCELLASHGMVVATTPLVGTASPLVQLTVRDLETQVRDLELAIAEARRLPSVSPDRLAAAGFDMGAMAALILTMRNPDVDALVTLDAAVLYGHPAGIPVDAPDYDPLALRCPWLHATQSQFGQRPPEHTGPDLPNQAVHADRYLLLVDGLDHAGFTSYALVAGRRAAFAYWEAPDEGIRLRYEVVCRYLLRLLQATLNDDAAARELLAGRGEEATPIPFLTLFHRPPQAPEPTYSDLLNALVAGDQEAIDRIAAELAAAEPGGPLHHEPTLNRLGYHLIGSWQLVDEAIAVFTVNQAMHPESVNTADSLGEGYLLKGDRGSALKWFGKVLELDPGNQRALEIIQGIEAENVSNE